jgi:hypothetical protein
MVKPRIRLKGVLNLVIEVAYSQQLSQAHRKMLAYFDTEPGIVAGILVDIEYPWKKVGEFFDYNNGKMVFYYYQRQQVDNDVFTATPVLYPLYAISFGDDPLTEDDMSDITRITGCTDIRGYGVGEEYPQCIRSGEHPTPACYRPAIDAKTLIVDDPSEPLAEEANQFLEHLLQIPGGTEVDLYSLKHKIHHEGLRAMNSTVARTLHIVNPQVIPERYRLNIL